MLAINNTQMATNKHNCCNHSKVNFTSDQTGPKNNSDAIRNTLAALALLGMVGCSSDDIINSEIESDYSNYRKEIAISDSINKNRSLDEYMTDLGFLQDGNKLGTVKTISFEDLNGTKHYLEKGDSTEVCGKKLGVGFHGVDIDKNGNRNDYDVKFEKYHQGLIATVTKDNPNYVEGGTDTIRFERNDGSIREMEVPSTPKDTTVYRFHANADGQTYTLQKAEGKGVILYAKIADVKKTDNGLLFEGYDWVSEKPTSKIELIQNIRNNETMPVTED